MRPEHKRIVEMADGWEGSLAEVTLGPGDAAALKGLGAPLKEGKRETDPARIVGRDLYRAAELIKQIVAAEERGERGEPLEPQRAAEPSAPPAPPVPPVVPPAVPVQPAVPPAPPAGDGLEDHTVAELREIATAEGVTVGSAAVKAQVIEAIRKGRLPK